MTKARGVIVAEASAPLAFITFVPQLEERS
ncbi:hypothetical protein FHX49_001599 [Microbacterium endophyticum]|uniref:Uncharacterized protein n=1 Tax=Microbacterium endophyticum TaxID=1526412 RepID=A0A7W4YMZ4_9MICO|nr:hypothetical protein [Microbacterium endophyticum]NIK35052.1 hypothetical protein [Microbacterium endophyticum]